MTDLPGILPKSIFDSIVFPQLHGKNSTKCPPKKNDEGQVYHNMLTALFFGLKYRFFFSGYVRKGGGLTQAICLGGGHLYPMDRPEAALLLLENFVSGKWQ